MINNKQSKTTNIAKARYEDAGHDLVLEVTKTEPLHLELLEIALSSLSITDDIINNMTDEEFQIYEDTQPLDYVLNGKSASLSNLLSLYQDGIPFIALSMGRFNSVATLSVFGQYSNFYPCPTSIYLDLPLTYNPDHTNAIPAGLVLPRSGWAANYGIGIMNSPGLIDQGYKGEIKVILENRGGCVHFFTSGAKIAQLVMIEVLADPFCISQQGSSRDSSGFGSSGFSVNP